MAAPTADSVDREGAGRSPDIFEYAQHVTRTLSSRKLTLMTVNNGSTPTSRKRQAATGQQESVTVPKWLPQRRHSRRAIRHPRFQIDCPRNLQEYKATSWVACVADNHTPAIRERSS